MAVFHIVEGLALLVVAWLLYIAQEPLRRWSRRVYRGFPPLFSNWSLRVPPESLLFMVIGAGVVVWGVVDLLAA